MKHTLVLIALAILSFSCADKDKQTSVAASEAKNVPAFTEGQKELSVKELPLQTQDDTISYALGVAWAHSLGRAGIKNLAYSFYYGAHDYMQQNKTFINVSQAADRIDNQSELMKADENVRELNPDQKLKEINLATKNDTLNYLWAYVWSRGVKEIGISRITPTLMLGLSKGLDGDTTLFTYKKADRYLRGYVERLREQKFFEVKRKNDEWLTENKTKPDVVTLPSGLQYKVIKNGSGKSPQADDVIVCHYTAKLIDDVVFEDTYQQGEPLKAYPSGVIVAWREALPKMKVGSVWELYVPYQLGYGSGGIKDKVPPYATLIYRIELLGVGANGNY